MQLSGLPNKTAIMDCTTPENIHDLIQISDDLLKNQAVMRNSYGEKVTLEETHEERLSWFADQMIIQKKLREEKPSDTQPGSQHTLPPYIKEGLGPTSRLVSPLFAHLFEQRKHTDLPGLADKARSLRFWLILSKLFNHLHWSVANLNWVVSYGNHDQIRFGCFISVVMMLIQSPPRDIVVSIWQSTRSMAFAITSVVLYSAESWNSVHCQTQNYCLATRK